MVPPRDETVRNIEVLERWLTAIEKSRAKRVLQTIAIFNQKGGVGKTFTAINLSAMLAAHGHRTLLIDLDPQGHSGLGLGVKIESLERSIYDVLVDGQCPLDTAILRLRTNLDILPSNIDLVVAELEMARLKKKEARLKHLIDGLGDRYEYVVIDCSPSVRILTINALLASHLVIVPTIPSSFSIHGLSQVMAMIDSLRESFSYDPQVYFLITFWEKRPREAQLQKQRLDSAFGQYLFQTIIRKDTKLNEATRKGVPAFEYARLSRGSQDYLSLTREVMAIEVRGEHRKRAEEQAAVQEAITVGREKGGESPESRDASATIPETPKWPEAAADQIGPGVAQMENQRGRPSWAFLALLIGLFLLVPSLKTWRERVEWTDGEKGKHKIVSVQDREADEMEPQSAGRFAVSPPPVGFDVEGHSVESSRADVSAVEGAPVSLSIRESESQGSQKEETEEAIARIESREDPVMGSSATGDGYTVNVASFREKTRADRHIEELKKQGIEAFEWETEIHQKGRWHRVSIGNFPTIRDAQIFATELEERGFRTFVTRLRRGQTRAGLPEPEVKKEATPSDQEGGSPSIQEMRRLFR
jgi:chromosome partitioning protein